MRKRAKVSFDQRLSASAPYSGGVSQSHVAHSELDFSTGPNHTDPDELDRKKMLAMMFARKDRELRPWCDGCSKHKVGRVGKGLDAPVDTYCGICSKVAVEHGPRKVTEYHDRYCSTCGKKKPEKKIVQ